MIQDWSFFMAVRTLFLTRGVEVANESIVHVIDLGARLGREEERSDGDCCTRREWKNQRL